MTIDKSLIYAFVKSTEKGAYGASSFRGKNNKMAADKSAVDAMRDELNKIDIKGTIVIGEGEMDEAPMLYINEKVGTNKGEEYDKLAQIQPIYKNNCLSKYMPIKSNSPESW